jgi:hypothetical protein
MPPIPIYSVGFGKETDIVDLANLAKATGGFSMPANSQTLSESFAQISGALASQLIARVPICLPKGPQTGALRFQLNNVTLSENVDFQLTTNCARATATAPPVPFSIRLSPFQYDPSQDTLSFSVVGSGDGVAASYLIEVKYKDTNTAIPGRYGYFAATASRIEIPLSGVATKPLVVTVQALQQNGQPLGSPVSSEIIPPRVATPSVVPLSISVSKFQFDPVTDTVTFDIARQGNGDVDYYDIKLIYRSSNLLVENGSFKASREGTVKLSANGIRSEAITIKVQAIVKGGGPIGNEASGEITLTRPTPPPMTTTPTVTVMPANTAGNHIRYYADDSAHQFTSNGLPMALALPDMSFVLEK